MKRTKLYIPAPLPSPTLAQRVIKALGYISLGIIVYMLIIVLAFEFMAGCGEKTYHADGTWETNSCLFIPYTPTKGTWR